MPHPARAMHRALLQGEPWCIAAAGLSSLADRVGKRDKGKRKSEIFVWCAGWLVTARNSSQACRSLGPHLDVLVWILGLGRRASSAADLSSIGYCILGFLTCRLIASRLAIASGPHGQVFIAIVVSRDAWLAALADQAGGGRREGGRSKSCSVVVAGLPPIRGACL